MTHIEQAIRDAVEKGGYGKEPNSKIALKKDVIAWYVQDGVLLDPAFWQTLGKARGWRDNVDPYDGTPNWEPGSNQSTYGIPEWRYHWHRFIDHLAEGKDAESFFKDL